MAEKVRIWDFGRKKLSHQNFLPKFFYLIEYKIYSYKNYVCQTGGENFTYFSTNKLRVRVTVEYVLQ